MINYVCASVLSVVCGGGRRLRGARPHGRHLQRPLLEQGVRRRQRKHPRAARLQNPQQFHRLPQKGERTPSVDSAVN
jgi:hypothetical protein